MIAVLIYFVAIMFTVLFLFVMCFRLGGDEGGGGGGGGSRSSRRRREDDTTSWATTDSFLDDLIRMQICATRQRIDELTYQEIQLKMKLSEQQQQQQQQQEEGSSSENRHKKTAKLKKKLQRVSAKLQKARRRLEESRLDAEGLFNSLGLSRLYSNSDDDNNGSEVAAEADRNQRKEISSDRKELVERNMMTILYRLSNNQNNVADEETGSSMAMLRGNVNCSTTTNSTHEEENYYCIEANNDIDVDDVDPPCNRCHTDECIICLDEYQVGDILMKSNNQDNKKCIHQFHKDCILQWLRKHDHCPLCRDRLLVEDEEKNDDDVVEC